MSTADRGSSAEVPLLVVSGPTGRVAAAARTVAIVQTALVALLVLSVAVPFLIVAAIPAGPPGTAPGANPAFLVPMIVSTLGVICLAIALALVNHFLHRFITRRIGRADVFEDRIVIYKQDRTIELPWRKVKRLVVRSPDYVQVVGRFEIRGSPLHAIPTESPTVQRHLLELWTRQVSRVGTPAAATAPALLGRGSAGKLLLVAGGGAGWKRAKFWLELSLGVLYALAMIFVALVRHGAIASPWIEPLRAWLSGWQIQVLMTLGPILVYRNVRGWLKGHATARVGRAELFEHAIIFYEGDRLTTLAWSEVEGFDDGSADVVAIERRGPSRERFTIPTPDDDVRVRVLALLDEHEIPRRDPGGLVS